MILLNYYFFGCFIGYLIETVLKFFFFSSMKNGVLYGPWIPIYGLGILLILFLSNWTFSWRKKKTFKMIGTFFLFFFLVSVLEEIGGILSHALFHKKIWNYSKLWFNLGPYISIEMSFVWSLFGLLFILYVKPFLDLFIKKIPKVLTLSVLFLHILDIVLTLLTL